MRINSVGASNYGVQKNNNNPSFGMAWGEESKKLYTQVVDAATTSIHSKHGCQDGILGKFAQWVREKHTRSLIDKIGVKFNNQDFLSEAFSRDFHLRPNPNCGLEIVPVLFSKAQQDTQGAIYKEGRILKAIKPKIKPVENGEVLTDIGMLKRLGKVLDASGGYLDNLDAKRKAANRGSTVAMKARIADTEAMVQNEVAERIAEIRRDGSKRIAEGIGDAHVERASKRINGVGK